ncbi:MAG: multicopper oxidase domain-containing protein [Burkholderiaceae bacterium]|nr:multicopper oxidase domain-containing protein [Burkholderiaceae bacterium]
MNRSTRRHFIGGMAALGATIGASRDVFAARRDAEEGRPAREAAAIEGEAAAFANPLRLPGASGLYGVMRATDLREVRVVRSEIEVLPGKRTPYLAYAVESGGKTYLNPALLARRGEEMRLRMVNRLDEPTIIHWHGLSNDARNDGNGLVVAAPGQAYEYAFKLNDRASMYWYHPHAHGLIPRQAYHGLASLLFIEDDEELALRGALQLALGETEIPLVLQDRSFDAQGRLRYEPSTDQAFQGFIGERLLVNLTEHPFIQAARRIYRFRILNGSNARSYRLAFLQDGRPLGCYLAGTDGGLLAAAQRIEQSYISPGQRLDILLDLREAKEGRPVTLGTLGFDPMHAEGGGGSMAGMDHSKMAMPMAGEGEPHALLRIDVKPSPGYTNKIPATLSGLPAAKAPPGTPRRIKLAHDGKGQWTINGWSYDAKSVPLTVKRGAAETWLIENARASMPHPMHIHGFPFRVVERRGSPPQVRALAGAKGLLPQDLGATDTVQVWPGETLRIALDFSHSHAGRQDYVFHCHNLEHAEAGMMIRYSVLG